MLFPPILTNFIFSQRLTFLENRQLDYYQSNTYQKLFGIGYLNGTEIRYELNIVASKKEKAVLIETCRRLQDLYAEICAARFALITSCQVKYPEYLSADTDEQGHLWIQSQFVNTAILWYNATFDILLQVVWVYYGLYKQVKKEALTLNNIDDVLGRCKKKSVITFVSDEQIKKELDSFHSKSHSINMETQYKNQNISEWANTLKHRRMIEYEELDRKHSTCFITLSRLPEIVVKGQTASKENLQEEIKTLYNSNNTLKRIKMTDVINVLFEYHKDICQLSRLVFDKIEF